MPIGNSLQAAAYQTATASQLDASSTPSRRCQVSGSKFASRKTRKLPLSLKGKADIVTDPDGEPDVCSPDELSWYRSHRWRSADGNLRASKQILLAARSEQTAVLASDGPPNDGTLTGIWLRDAEASDIQGYERSLDHCFQMKGLEKETAMRLFEGMEIKQDADGMSVRYLTVVPFFQIREQFSFKHKTTMKRRDARQGEQTAQPLMQLHRGVAMVVDWGPPLPGHLEDLYSLEGTDGRTMHVRSHTTVEDRVNDTVQVFRWAPSWKPRYSWPFG